MERRHATRLVQLGTIVLARAVATAGCSDDNLAVTAIDAGADIIEENDGGKMSSDASTGNAPAPKLTIRQEQGSYVFRFGRWSMVVDPSLGGRIRSFTVDGRDVMAGHSVNPDNWGSTFWPSPQSAWGWPPPAILDSQPYTADLTGSLLTLRSDKFAPLGLIVVKKLTADAATGVVSIEYIMRNEGTTARSLAPWEITRVPAGGVTFYPTGVAAGRTAGLPEWGAFKGLTERAGISWYGFEETQGEQKWVADGAEGWLAYACDDAVLVKVFPDVAPAEQAPDEGEIELYLSPVRDGGRYIEVENQGRYTPIEPGTQVSWTVRWYLSKLPAPGMATVGNVALVNFVRGLIE